MPPDPSFTLRRLAHGDGDLMSALLDMFGKAFGDAQSCCSARPGSAYVERLLGSGHFIALAAQQHGCDLSGNGTVSVLDARKLALLFTQRGGASCS